MSSEMPRPRTPRADAFETRGPGGTDETDNVAAGTSGVAPGERIGRYRVVRLLGGGSFGMVYLACDDALDREVAVKISKWPFTSSRALDEFCAEARALARLDHPHILPVYDVGQTADNRAFVVSRYIAGSDCKTVFLRSRLTPRQTAELIAAAADALQHAHQRGVVHRDVKPGNILLGEGNHPWLVDFGLALDARRPGGLAGELLGTPAYMSPEQVRGEAHRVDGRTDIWALGVVMYEALTGGPPFCGADLSTLFNAILHREPKPPRQIDERIPAELERICLACLARPAAERYAAAADLARELRAWLQPARPAAGAGELRVVQCTPVESDPLPVYTVTLMNRSGGSQVIVGVRVEVLEFRPLRGAATRPLLPIAVWDVPLPSTRGTATVASDPPILIGPDDAARLSLRLFGGDSAHPVHPASQGSYRLTLTFLSDSGLEATSPNLTLGRI